VGSLFCEDLQGKREGEEKGQDLARSNLLQERRVVIYHLNSVYDETMEPWIRRVRSAIEKDQDE
jgi:hypothetical protein